MEYQKNEIDELSDTGYSEDDSIETFLNFKPRKSIVEENKLSDNFEYTKVVEVFISRDHKVFAHCSLCLYKTEIKNINYLLEHFLTTHETYCKNNCNISNFYTNFKSTSESENDYVTIKNEIENTAQCSTIDIITTSVNKNDDSTVSEMKEINKTNKKYLKKAFEMNINYDELIKMNEIAKANKSSLENFENNLSYLESSESSHEFSCSEVEEIEDNLSESEKNYIVQENIETISEVKSKSQSPCLNNVDPDYIQQLDEKFYSQLSRLDPDQSLCHFCNTKFRCISRHYKNQHPELILCEVGKCYQTFNTLPELDTHHKRFHNDPKYAFTCTICFYKTNNFNNFRFHYLRIHLNIKSFNCDFCEMKFFSNYEKAKHLRSHTGQKPYICEICDSKYPTKQQLNLHIQKYHSEPKFECNICNKKFHRKQTLKEHQMTKHSSSEKKEICEICGTRFYLRKNLRGHFNNFHNPDRKRWTCNICGKSYSRNSYVKEHVCRLQVKKKKLK